MEVCSGRVCGGGGVGGEGPALLKWPKIKNPRVHLKPPWQPQLGGATGTLARPWKKFHIACGDARRSGHAAERNGKACKGRNSGTENSLTRKCPCHARAKHNRYNCRPTRLQAPPLRSQLANAAHEVPALPTSCGRGNASHSPAHRSHAKLCLCGVTGSAGAWLWLFVERKQGWRGQWDGQAFSRQGWQWKRPNIHLR